MTLQIKICGLTEPAGVAAAIAAGADYLGLVFADSPRRVTPEEAGRLVQGAPGRWVGVLIDPQLDEATRLAGRLDLAAFQLHGQETPEFCRRLRAATGRPVWKALAWTGSGRSIRKYAGSADAVLLDASSGLARGGIGKPLPWDEIAERYPPEGRPLPLFLAGGLGPDNVGRAITTVRPDGIDASSGLESAPGVKDPGRVAAFVGAARALEETRARLE